MHLFRSRKKEREHWRDVLIDLFGWYGVLAIIAAYGMISFDLIQPHSLVYQGLNLTGSLGILIDAYMMRNYQPVALNVVWIGIAIVAIIRIV